ncbi:MAG: amidohydrolase family protein [Thermodesulfobacteriota bacterium]
MGGTRYILAGGLIDGTGGAVRRNVVLTVEDGFIAAIGSAAGHPRSGATPIDDLSHCVIVPALVDCSVSLARSPVAGAQSVSPAEKSALVAAHCRYCHDHGVLGVAENDDLSGLLEPDRAGGLLALRVAGADFLKIRYSPGMEEEEAVASGVSHDDLHRILQHKGGKRAVVVANGSRQVAEALAAGCDAVEQGYAMGEANLRLMAARGVLWLPRLLTAKNGLDGARSDGAVCCRFSQRYVAPGKPLPGAEVFWKKTLADQMAQLRLARELGVAVAVGTGAGSFGILHGESVVEEMKLFMKAGYSLEETIRCASANGAAFFGMKNLGALTVGRRATFLVTRGAVSQLPRKLAYLENIYVDGVPSIVYRKNPVRGA